MGPSCLGAPTPCSRPSHLEWVVRSCCTDCWMLHRGEWGGFGGQLLRQRQTTWRGHQARGSRVPGTPVAREDAWTSEASGPSFLGPSEEVPFCSPSPVCVPLPRTLLPGHLCPAPILSWVPQGTVAPSPRTLAYVSLSPFTAVQTPQDLGLLSAQQGLPSGYSTARHTAGAQYMLK